MKILFLDSVIVSCDLIWGLVALGHEVVVTDDKYKADGNDETSLIRLREKLLKEKFDFAVGYDFIPELALILYENKCIYASWVFDCPMMSLYHPYAKLSTNRIFVFDRIQYDRVKRIGVEYIYHLPLGANMDRIDSIELSDEDEIKYSSDISFVGNMYTENNYDAMYNVLGSEDRKHFDDYLLDITKTLGNNSDIYNYLTDEDISLIKSKLTKASINDIFDVDDNFFYTNQFLVRKAANEDRVKLLNELAKHFKVDLYAGASYDSRLLVDNKGGVSYDSDCNKVFYFSKININITNRSIESGVPQRIYDCLGSGGFVMTNYQKELEDEFIIGEDLVVYDSIEDLVRKAYYYLKHDKERLTITLNGHKKVRNKYNYRERMKTLIDTVVNNPYKPE